MTKELEVLTGEDEIEYQNLVEIGGKVVKALGSSGLETPYLRAFKRNLDEEFREFFQARRKHASKAKKENYEKKIKEYQEKIDKL